MRFCGFSYGEGLPKKAEITHRQLHHQRPTAAWVTALKSGNLKHTAGHEGSLPCQRCHFETAQVPSALSSQLCLSHGVSQQCSLTSYISLRRRVELTVSGICQKGPAALGVFQK